MTDLTRENMEFIDQNHRENAFNDHSRPLAIDSWLGVGFSIGQMHFCWPIMQHGLTYKIRLLI
jgi:hypothetical protein